MNLKSLLVTSLRRAAGDAEPGAVLFYECRDCGVKFDEQCERCSVCGSMEIATYTFPSNTSTEDP